MASMTSHADMEPIKILRWFQFEGNKTYTE